MTAPLPSETTKQAPTPGPWRVEKAANGQDLNIVFGSEGCWLATVWASEVEGQAEADATLIAAAPEMLEALKGMVRYAESVRLSMGMGKSQQARFEAAKAAIARATGAA